MAQTLAARVLQLASSLLGRFSPQVQTRLVGWVQLGVEVRVKSDQDDTSTQAAALTYAAFLSLFPLLLLGLSVTGVLVRYGASTEWFHQLARAIPGLDALINNQGHLLAKSAGDLGLIGLIAVLWTGSVLTSRGERAMGVVFGLERRVLVNRTRALAITILLGLCLLASLTLTGIVAGLRIGGALTVPTRLAAGALLFVLELGYFTVTYRLLTLGHKIPMREHLRGALLMTIGWTALKYIGNVFVDHTISRASALYGTIGAVFGLLLAIRIASWIFLCGAEITSIALRDRGDPWAPKRRARWSTRSGARTGRGA